MIFSSRRFLQKTNERILLYYYKTSGWLFLFVFLGKIEDILKLTDLYDILELKKLKELKELTTCK